MDRDSPVGAKQSTVSLKTTNIIPIKYLVNTSDYQTESFFPPDEFGIIGWPIKGVALVWGRLFLPTLIMVFIIEAKSMTTNIKSACDWIRLVGKLSTTLTNRQRSFLN
uniref:Uncharacterized protein n=1 Tax=Clytia hemisphaerica TaxID=252671 RepID=A0A7M5X312_9CNID